jgi:hypothetical protein
MAYVFCDYSGTVKCKISMISNSRMQITLLSFLFKNINIIKKGINKDTLKLYAVLFSCFIYAKPKVVGF